MPGCLSFTSGPSEPKVSPVPCTSQVVGLGGLTSLSKVLLNTLPNVCGVCVCASIELTHVAAALPYGPMEPTNSRKRSEFRIGQFTLLYLRSFMVPKTGPQIWQAVAFGRSDGPALVGRKWTLF